MVPLHWRKMKSEVSEAAQLKLNGALLQFLAQSNAILEMGEGDRVGRNTMPCNPDLAVLSCLASCPPLPCGRRGFSEVEGMKSESRQTAATTDFGRGREDTKRKEKRRGRSKRWLRELFYKWQTDRRTVSLTPLDPARSRSPQLGSIRQGGK